MNRYRLSRLAEIANGFGLLAAHPNAGRLRHDIAAGVRSLPVKNYIIYYQPSEHGLLVSRILHGKRDQMAVLDPA